MGYTIQDAQSWYDTYGVVSVVNGDDMSITIYDDEQDMEAGWMIDQYSIV